MDQENDIVADGGRLGSWRIRLAPDRMILKRSDSGGVYEFRRSEDLALIKWDGLTVERPYLTVRVPKPVKLKIDPVDAITLSEWFGPPAGGHLGAALRHRLSWALPMGLVWLLSSWPIAADPAAGRPASPFDGFAMFLGAVLVLESVIARVVVRRELFLVDAAWFILVAGKTAYGFLTGANSVLWAALIPLCGFQVLEDIKRYGDFAPDVTEEAEVIGRR